MHIAETTYQKLTRLISNLAGIELPQHCEKRLVNRIAKRLNAVNVDSLERYYEYVAADEGGTERQALIEAVTTHYTSFFRDIGQFAHVREELKTLLLNGQHKLRIWSAACSSGEEPYSLAITALEATRLAGVKSPDIRILATDISRQILQDASEGWFPLSSLQKLTVLQRNYFEPIRKRCEITGEPMLRVNKQLRDLVIFRRVNLCDRPLQVPSAIDVIFCRNVLLYFNPRQQQSILDSLTSRLNSGGLLYVGASEQVRGFLPQMTPERACVFRKTSNAQASTLTPAPWSAPFDCANHAPNVRQRTI